MFDPSKPPTCYRCSTLDDLIPNRISPYGRVTQFVCRPCSQERSLGYRKAQKENAAMEAWRKQSQDSVARILKRVKGTRYE